MLKISEINQSPKAKRKLASIAKQNDLPLSFVETLFQLFWNYDLAEPSWVTDTSKQDDNYVDHTEKLFQQVIDLQPDSLLSNYNFFSADNFAQAILDSHKRIDETKLLQTFKQSVLQKNFTNISKFSTYHYFRNANFENLAKIPFYRKDRQPNQIEKESWLFLIFVKIFRAGCVDRYNLAYPYIDFCIKLPYIKDKKQTSKIVWLSDFLLDLEQANSKLTLSDLRKILRQHVKGNNQYLQIILESLANARLLKVGEYNSNHVFLPEYHNTLSKHFYSNDWAYPLRMWNEL